MSTRTKLFADLPPFAKEFVQTKASSLRTVHWFHQWLRRSHRSILQLEAHELESFLRELEAVTITQSSRSRHRRLALDYFEWLHSRALLRFDPRRAWPRSNYPLPADAQRFLDSLKPTRKLSTVRCYQSSLRQFHIWLQAENVDIQHVERRHLEAWLSWLHQRGLHPGTRLCAIQNIRVYLDWLGEHELLEQSPGALLRSSDLPKLPQYLPRPLPAHVDSLLQARLRKSHSNHQLGLLLMRRTGLRIGELISLPYDCVRYDPAGRPSLLVPLGKLDTERLVPLDPKTCKLVAKLRRIAKRKNHWLLQSPTGKKTHYAEYRDALRAATRGLSTSEPITTHRLRHTYATALLTAGMSLPTVMRLLGHRDYRMTLRYAAITDETVRAEFYSALEKIETRYSAAPKVEKSPPPASPSNVLSNAARLLGTHLRDEAIAKPEAHKLLGRLRRLDAAWRKLLRKNRR